MGDVLLREVTLVDGTVTDVRLSDGVIGSVGAVEAGPNDEVLDLSGHLLTATAVEPHAHLDKAFLAERLDNLTGDLLGAIDTMIAARPTVTVDDTIARAERAARLMATNGYSAVRTHVDTTLDHGLRSVEALVEVRRRVADLIDVQVVAMSGWPVTGPAGAAQRRLLADALALGADLIGGCPHLDPAGTWATTETLLTVAAEHAVAVDLHTDETLEPDVGGLAELAELVSSTGFPHPVVASHCCSLGMQPLEDQRRVAEAVAAAGIAVVSLPGTNLYLQGRDHQQAMPRGVTAVKALRQAGVTVAAGADNLQDPFNPIGKGCPFDTAALMIMTNHLRPVEAWRSTTDAARCALSLPPITLQPGDPADLLAVPAATIREAIAFAPRERVVIRRGRILSRPG